MTQAIVEAISVAPSWLRVIILTIIPVTEYQLSVPLGLLDYHLAPILVIALAWVGGALIFFPLYFGLLRLRTFCVQYLPWLVVPLDRFLARGERKLGSHYKDYGMIGLLLFFLIPLPLTGVWTATFGAVALKIPLKQAAIGILSGLLIGAAVVTLITVGADSWF